MIKDVDGVPHWFTKVVHHVRVRHCRKHGHVGTPRLGKACEYCGYLWFSRPDDQTP